MAEVASAFVSLLPSARGFGSKLDSQVGPEVDASGKTAGKRLSGALVGALKVGAVAGGLAIGAVFASSIGAASDAQQSLGGTQAVFGKFAKTVIGDSKAASDQFGLSANDYRENANIIGSLLKNQGVGLQSLGGETKKMIGLSSDLAATFGGTTKDAVTALAAAYKGEFDPLQNYGVTLKQSTINTEAYRVANVKSTAAFNKLSTAQQQSAVRQATTNLILNQSKAAAGQFGKQTNTLAEQQQILGAKVSNLKVQLGTFLLPILTKVASYLSGSVVPAISQFVTQLRTGEGAGGQVASAFKVLGAVLEFILPKLVALGGFLARNKATVGAFAGVILTVVAALKVWTAVQLLLNVALTANPIGLIVVAIAALVAGIVYAYQHSTIFRNIVVATFTAIRAVVVAVVTTVVGFVKAHWRLLIAIIAGPLGVIVGLVISHWSQVKTIIVVAVAILRRAVSIGFNAIRAVVGAVVGALVGHFQRAKAGLKLLGSAFIAAIKFAVQFQAGVLRAVGKAINFIREIPGKAKAALGNLGSLLVHAGQALVDGLIRGITSRIAAVRAKIAELASVIKAHLPGSPVKTGPLTSWNNGGAGKRLVGLLADGLSDTRQVDSAMNRLSSRVALKAPQLSVAGTTAGGSGVAGAGGGGVFHLYDSDGVLLGTMSGAADRRISGHASQARTVARQGSSS